MSEIWKLISEDTKYSVSNCGSIKVNKTNRIMKQHISRGGYYAICIGKKHRYSHRLVALEFLSNFENKPEINHIDGNKLNNNASNLEWIDRSNNMKHAYNIHLMQKPKGIKHPKAKLTEADVMEIKRLVKLGISQTEVSQQYNLHKTTINRIILGKAWSHVNG